MSDERRYSEAELRAIIERAAQRQESARQAQDASEDGLTLAELQQIGVASGIDPAHIASAVAELVYAAPSAKPASFAGMPAEVRQSRFIPSDVSDEAWGRIVAELRREFDSAGIAGEVGRVREWTTQVRRKGAAAVHIALEPVDGGTHIVIEQALRKTAVPFAAVSGAYALVALLLGVLFLSGVLDPGAGFVPVMFLALAALMFGGGQVGLRLYARRQDRRFEHTLDRIELLARGGAPAASPSVAREASAPEQAATPRLDLDALPDDEREPPVAFRGRTRS